MTYREALEEIADPGPGLSGHHSDFVLMTYWQAKALKLMTIARRAIAEADGLVSLPAATGKGNV